MQPDRNFVPMQPEVKNQKNEDVQVLRGEDVHQRRPMQLCTPRGRLEVGARLLSHTILQDAADLRPLQPAELQLRSRHGGAPDFKLHRRGGRAEAHPGRPPRQSCTCQADWYWILCFDGGSHSSRPDSEQHGSEAIAHDIPTPNIWLQGSIVRREVCRAGQE
mmetsp:Transcript_46210/g.147681  ORF Transcript_46210/g.147681 Transcript_46210/m.147681 type:complete len:162 (-) Transcript_46210:867-1352(-)